MGQKLIDTAYLAQLINGSYETRWGAVTEAMEDAANADLFGGPDSQVIATFDDRVVVAAPDGVFYRAEWTIDEEAGKVVFSNVEELDVPVFEATELGPHVRSEAVSAVDALLSGRDEDADGHIGNLMGMVSGGAKLTAEGVEDMTYRQTTAQRDHDWFLAVAERREAIEKFVGAEMERLPVAEAMFENIEASRASVQAALGTLRSKLSSLWERMSLAVEIDDDYTAPTDQMGVVEFVEFVDGFATDFDVMIGCVEEALSVAEDGDVSALARVHDSVAAQYPDFALTAAFVEKMARRFAPPKAA